MPRVTKRQKVTTTTTNNNAGEEEKSGASQRKIRKVAITLPERSSQVCRVLVCGQGDMGQLGLGDDTSKTERKRPALLEDVPNPVDIKAGGMHNLILTKDGDIYTFGCNDEGALGRDSSVEGSEFKPQKVDLPAKALKISAGDSHSACILEDGRVFAWGSFRDSHGNMGLTLEGNKRLAVEVLPGVQCCDIASGADHLVILTCDGKVYTVGCAEQGQLGRITSRSASGESRRGKTDLLSPGMVTVLRTGVIRFDKVWASNYCTFLREARTGYIYAFGLNNYKQLAYGKNLSVVTKAIKTSLEDVKQIAGGQHHTLILKNNGQCYAIGRHDYGRLGLGALENDVESPQLIKELEKLKIASISCGEAQSFAVTEDGDLYSWGMGSNLQLGTGTEDDELLPVVIKSKQTQGKRFISSSSGGQHSIFLIAAEEKIATLKENENKENDSGTTTSSNRETNASSTVTSSTKGTIDSGATSSNIETSEVTGSASLDEEMNDEIAVPLPKATKSTSKRGRSAK